MSPHLLLSNCFSSLNYFSSLKYFSLLHYVSPLNHVSKLFLPIKLFHFSSIQLQYSSISSYYDIIWVYIFPVIIFFVILQSYFFFLLWYTYYYTPIIISHILACGKSPFSWYLIYPFQPICHLLVTEFNSLQIFPIFWEFWNRKRFNISDQLIEMYHTMLNKI
jgi:hypothetical protein